MFAQERNRALPRVGGSFSIVDFRPRVVEESVIGVLIDLHVNLLAEILQLSFEIMDHRWRDGFILLSVVTENGRLQVRQIRFHFRMYAVEDYTRADLRIL